MADGESRDHGEFVERALIDRRAEVHRLREIFCYEKIVDRKIVTAGPAQARDAPGVEDFHIRGGHRDFDHLGDSVGAHHRRAFFNQHRAHDEDVGLLASAAEGPSSRQAIATVGPHHLAGSHGARNDRVRNRRNEQARFGRTEMGRQQAAVERDHYVPSRCAVGVTDFLDRRQDLRERSLESAQRGGNAHREKSARAHRVDDRRREPAPALGLVGMRANERQQLARDGDWIVVN